VEAGDGVVISDRDFGFLAGYELDLARWDDDSAGAFYPRMTAAMKRETAAALDRYWRAFFDYHTRVNRWKLL
jgi:hypothetical protein